MKPLSEKRVLITRARGQARELSDRLKRLGARPVFCPVIRIGPIPSWTPVDRQLRRLNGYDIILFSSVNGVDRFWWRLKVKKILRSSLRHLAFWAIGPATAARLRVHGVRPDLIPDEFSSEGLARALRKYRLDGKKILYPRANIGSPVAIREIRRRGGAVRVLPIYRILKATRKSFPDLSRVDAVTFASAQTVRNFAAAVSKQTLALLLKRAKIACIGPVTAREVRRQGWTVHAMAGAYTMSGLVEAVKKLWSSKRGRVD